MSLDWLRSRREDEDNEFVFAYVDGISVDTSTVTQVSIRAVRKAELDDIRLHDLRHNYTSLELAAPMLTELHVQITNICAIL